MAFNFSERHIAEYHHHGCTVFRGILPPSLVADLRRATGKGRGIARETKGPQAQRLQPLGAFAEQLDPRPFRDYHELPALRDALHRVLSPAHELAGLERMGVFYEPAEFSWCTLWHRDVTEDSAGVDAGEFRNCNADPLFFVQVNCALYADISTWYVPGSVARADLPAELEAAGKRPELEGKPEAERERLCLAYAQAMPGAVQFVLEAGDFALYRPNGWHIGNYAPYRKRATLHDNVWNPASRAWYARWQQARKARPKAVGV